MTTLVVPGVRVEARFDVLPPLPAPAGILGVVGIVDRPPSRGTIGVTKPGEVRQLLGPGTEVSMPELMQALANGISEAIVAPVVGGSSASVMLDNPDGDSALRLRCRSNGAWGNALRVDVRTTANASGEFVRATIRLLLGGQVVEEFPDLQIAAGQPDDVFEAINARSRYVVAIDPGFEDAVPANGTYAFSENATTVNVPREGAAADLFQLFAAPGVDTTGLSVTIDVNEDDEISLQVFQGGLQESFSGLVMNPDDDNYLPYVLLAQSRLIRVRPLASQANALPAATAGPVAFENGTSPNVQAYRDAIDLLSEDPRIDLVLASIEPGRAVAEVRQIHQALVAHCVAMADNGAPRIAFGSITAAEQDDLDQIRDHAASVRNRRFVLVAPAGAEGAVAGVIGRLRPHFSATFKAVPLHGIQPASFRESQLNRLLGPSTNLLVVQQRAGRGVVVLRAIDTTGDQISVTRVADQCIRETKAIAENFIGLLNTEEARIALREQIVATFTRMERDNALVPSTDGSDPAFHVDVYSTQQDFAQGIVRIDIAVRPVRAIDYIYATIRVKN